MLLETEHSVSFQSDNIKAVTEMQGLEGELVVLVAGLALDRVHPVAVELEDPGEAVLHGQHLQGLLLGQAGSLREEKGNWSSER